MNGSRCSVPERGRRTGAWARAPGLSRTTSARTSTIPVLVSKRLEMTERARRFQRSLLPRALTALAQLAGTMTLAVFVPAGTLRYWQGWAFLVVFMGASIAITVWLAEHDPSLLARRMHAGPSAETEPSQKLIQALAIFAFFAALVVPALDHRYGWSRVPTAASLLGLALVTLGFLVILRVFRVNAFAASTIRVEAEQPVISTGPYAIVRHPMYVGGLFLFLGLPLALGSYWGLLVAVFALGMLVWRLIDEERFLRRNLPGYDAYCQKTRYRLVPGVW